MIITHGSRLLESTNLDNIVLEASSIGIEPDCEGAAVVIQESLMDYMNLQEAVFKIDLLEATRGDEAAVMQELYEVQVPKFIDNIIAGAKRFWSWLLEMVEKAMDKFNKLVLSDKQFVTHYGPKVIAIANPSSRLKEYKGFNWDISAIGDLSKSTNTAKNALPISGFEDVASLKTSADAKSVLDKVAKVDAKVAVFKAFGVGSVKELKDKFLLELAGSKEPVAITNVNAKAFIEAIASAKEDISAIKKEQGEIKKAFAGQMKALDEVKRTYSKVEEGDDKTLRSSLAAAINAAKDIEAAVNTVRVTHLGVVLTALSRRRSEYKSVIVAIAGGGAAPEQKAVGESLDSLIWG